MTKHEDTKLGAGGLKLVSPIPLYGQIKDMLRKKILDGSYPPHSKLPSESELMALFDVSRITARQAIRDLQKEGLVFTIQGKGSFVTKPKAVQDLTRLEGFGEAMNSKGYETYSRLIGVREMPASSEVARALQLSRDTSVVEIERVRYLNRSPISLDISYFSLDIGRRLMDEDLETRDIFVILENDYALPLGAADIVINATVADEREAELLAIESGAPILRMERLTSTRDGTPIDYEHLYYIGEAYQYRLRIERR
ncbi:GntR family transcriptional regulator [Acidihalobacter yilgarnensis]|uniref:GntR family transcriptional regulator n=1 Tax=Acidihalobacter yilgarnensis TaxID=2819280 RepID=A0A1D8ISI6_9GAMM|nr:GntR family transcriptional regulator [Acidihalobacter yilgarnensis]AOU99367.1 GntR family transcriptional regulator [Acidihalobacter yilgarnensis]